MKCFEFHGEISLCLVWQIVKVFKDDLLLELHCGQCCNYIIDVVDVKFKRRGG